MSPPETPSAAVGAAQGEDGPPGPVEAVNASQELLEPSESILYSPEFLGGFIRAFDTEKEKTMWYPLVIEIPEDPTTPYWRPNEIDNYDVIENPYIVSTDSKAYGFFRNEDEARLFANKYRSVIDEFEVLLVESKVPLILENETSGIKLTNKQIETIKQVLLEASDDIKVLKALQALEESLMK